MKALTVKPPWSWAIARGGKNVENRTWAHPWRGPIAIHAGKSWDEDGEDSPMVLDAWTKFAADLPPMNCHHGPLRPESLWMEFGAVIAVATLTDVCSPDDEGYDCECGPWAVPYQYHWRLTDVRPLAEPVPARGALGLWTLPDEVEAAVRAQLGAEGSR